MCECSCAEAKSKLGYEFDNWMRTKAPNTQKEQYSRMRSRLEKVAFRKDWAEQCLKYENETFQASRSLVQTSSQKGSWLPLKRIAQELGDDMEAAVRFCKTCIEAGPAEYYLDVS